MLRSLLRDGYRLRASARLLSSTISLFSDTATKPVSKEAMLILRKRTGYSFVNCRKALVKFGDENLDAAEKYLKEMALKEGWEKAAKVGSRQTTQGQCGVVSTGNMAAIVELMCETDFVGNSAPFKALVAELAKSVLAYAQQNKSIIRKPAAQEDGSRAVDVDPQQLRTAGGRPANEAIAAVIGELGENITFRSAHLLVSQADVNVLGFTHPVDVVDNVGIGRFVSAVGIRKNEGGSGFPVDKLAYQLCQHIIGMNPTSLGEADSTKKNNANDEEPEDEEDFDKSKKKTDEDEDLNSFSDVKSTSMDENETQLLRQAFMLNPRQTVADYLDVHACEIVDFWRVELGKSDTQKSSNNTAQKENKSGEEKSKFAATSQ